MLTLDPIRILYICTAPKWYYHDTPSTSATCQNQRGRVSDLQRHLKGDVVS